MFSGLLFFPVTPFDRSDEVDADVLAEHVRRGVMSGAGAVFAACGTGEFHALSLPEHETVVAVSVAATAGRMPVVAGVGGPVPVAVEQARRAAHAGADAVLLLPPYLVRGTDSGMVAYVTAVATAVDLPVVVYQRDNARFSLSAAVRVAALPNVVGFKDGTGDLDRLQRIVHAVRQSSGSAFQFFNGTPTAEVLAPAYTSIGVPLYSSAVYCFAPVIAMAFHAALQARDDEAVNRLLDVFYLPLVALRDRHPGYAVALVKAGVRLTGLEVGGVRAPLSDPTAAEVAELERLVAAGLAAVEQSGSPTEATTPDRASTDISTDISIATAAGVASATQEASAAQVRPR